MLRAELQKLRGVIPSTSEKTQAMDLEAERLACYAKQANDDKLLAMSNRIKARAVLRMGELFNEIESAQGARHDLTSKGRPSQVGKYQAAIDAGVSQDQRKQAQFAN